MMSSSQGRAGTFAMSVVDVASATDKAVDIGAMPEWDLGDLYSDANSDTFKADLARAEQEASDFQERYRGKLEGFTKEKSSGDKLLEAIEAFEGINDLIGRIGAFAGLLYAANTADPDRAKFFGDIQEFLNRIATKLLFFTLEMNRLTDKILKIRAVERYRPWIEDLRKEKPYQLSDDIERLFHEKAVSGCSAWNRLFTETVTSLRFEIEGEELSLEPALNYLMHAEEKKRRVAANALAGVFKTNERLFTIITNTLAKDKEISDRWRGFEDVADSRHLANRVERPVVEALVEAVRQAYPRLSHRYYTLKAGWLGKEKLAHWDRNAPLPEKPTRVIGWDEAEDIVLSSYRTFSGDMADIARAFFEKGWIDAPVREGKSPGAFSHPTVPSAHPYILLNYQGTPRDVMTLAHELGHGVHQVLANEQGALMAPTPLTLAETASVFGEMLTFQKLLGEAKEPLERRALLASKVEDMINTVVRQVAFYSFERTVHQERRNGELTSVQLADIWLKAQSESLGPAVELKEGYETFWCYVPHFIHSPFYVYAYAFGECLVNSLYAVYGEANEGFAEKYLDMLRAGGSKHHKELLAPFGLDASNPNFWFMGLTVIERLIDELEAIER